MNQGRGSRDLCPFGTFGRRTRKAVPAGRKKEVRRVGRKHPCDEERGGDHAEHDPDRPEETSHTLPESGPADPCLGRPRVAYFVVVARQLQLQAQGRQGHLCSFPGNRPQGKDTLRPIIRRSVDRNCFWCAN